MMGQILLVTPRDLTLLFHFQQIVFASLSYDSILISRIFISSSCQDISILDTIYETHKVNTRMRSISLCLNIMFEKSVVKYRPNFVSLLEFLEKKKERINVTVVISVF
jgi:hypothetical protein